MQWSHLFVSTGAPGAGGLHACGLRRVSATRLPAHVGFTQQTPEPELPHAWVTGTIGI